MNRLLPIFLAFGLFSVTAAHATVTFAGSNTDAHPLSANATFTISGGNLTIVLTNTDLASGAYSNPWGLSGIFWDFAGAGGGSQILTGSSATVVSGSILTPSACDAVVAGYCNTATNVGGEFGYQKGSYSGGMPTGIGGYGVASSGYLRGSANFTGGVNLDNPLALDGPNFSIVGKNSSGLTPTNPSIKEKVTFVLTGLSGIAETAITNVRFQYGTSFSETGINACLVGGTGCTSTPGSKIPEPASLALVGLGLLGVVLGSRRRQTGWSLKPV